jgi:hypothetical protein
VDWRASTIVCDTCKQDYPRIGSIVVAMPQVDAHLRLWRGQLDLIKRLAEEQAVRLDAEATATDILPKARHRLVALARAVRDQLGDVTSAFAPLAEAVRHAESMELPATAQSPLAYLHYLYRDWAWEQAGSEEITQALTDLRCVAGSASLGRTLVFGAAGCRLPYELHRGYDADEVVAIDIDPFTFVLAESIVRGRALRLTEANLAVQADDNVARTWTLRATAAAGNEGKPDGKLHLVLGNGLAPPFAAGVFDTVVTPWFIDQVPLDAGKFIETLAQTIKPGGRWLNQGPLLYRVDLPLSRRHTREEIFDLAENAGFRVDKWATDQRAYLVSPLNGRGRVESVLTFAATRTR